MSWKKATWHQAGVPHGGFPHLFQRSLAASLAMEPATLPAKAAGILSVAIGSVSPLLEGVEPVELPEHSPKFALVLLFLLYRGDPESHASPTVQSTRHPLHGDKFYNDLRSGTKLETKSPPQLQVSQGPQGLQTPFVPFPRMLRGPPSPTSSSPTFKARVSESHPSGAFNSAHCPRGCVA